MSESDHKPTFDTAIKNFAGYPQPNVQDKLHHLKKLYVAQWREHPWHQVAMHLSWLAMVGLLLFAIFVLPPA